MESNKQASPTSHQRDNEENNEPTCQSNATSQSNATIQPNATSEPSNATNQPNATSEPTAQPTTQSNGESTTPVNPITDAQPSTSHSEARDLTWTTTVIIPPKAWVINDPPYMEEVAQYLQQEMRGETSKAHLRGNPDTRR